MELLARIGVVPDETVPADVDETPLRNEPPRGLATRLARAKAERIARARPGRAVLGADTVVARGRRVLPKPADEAEARACLELLSGRRHVVHGGVCLAANGSIRVRHVATRVGFKRLSSEEIAWYLASGEWRDKAGGYAAQGRAAAFIDFLNGSCSNVVGLPLHETAVLLRAAGVRPA